MERPATGTYRVTSVGVQVVRAFVPLQLPPVPRLELSSERQRLLERSTYAVGRLDSIGTLLPNPQLFLSLFNRCFT